MASNFLQLVDNQDVSKVQSFLFHNQKLEQKTVDYSFELCCGHRENFFLLEYILQLKPSQDLIDRKLIEKEENKLFFDNELCHPDITTNVY